MFFEAIKSPGLAHVSYIFGSKGEAVVIDPRRDCDIYRDIARAKNARITHIFETHRNEDYVIGSTELAHLTGAQIYHGANMDFAYGNPVSENDRFKIGSLMLQILETPGHTFESISIVLYDTSTGDDPLAVFTGDCLFIGDVGRTDFFPDRAQEVAGLLYDSIFIKLLPLGDQVILYPAHGAGSVCGSGMASRDISTLGYERKNNPVLQKNREDFISYKVNEHHYMPPYFKMMEEYNQNGAPELGRLPLPAECSAEAFESLMQGGMTALDIRSPEAVCGAFVPGSLAIPLNMIPAFAGWFLSYDRQIGLISDNSQSLETAVRYLVRMGYDHIIASLAGGLHSWEVAAKPYDSIRALHAQELIERIEREEDFLLLDVRSKDEFEHKHLPRARHIYVGELPDQINEVPKDKLITTFCGSGRRALIAASYLKLNGFEQVEDCLGSMKACSKLPCPALA